MGKPSIIIKKKPSSRPRSSTPFLRLVGSDHALKQNRPRPKEKIDLGNVLIELVGHIHRSRAIGSRISLGAKLCRGVPIDLQCALTLSQVVREIVINAYKYSHPNGTSVEVTMSCGLSPEGDVILDVGDDGIGLPPGFAEWRDAGIGIVTIRSKLQKIGAELSITSDDLGLRFQIILYTKARRSRAPVPARDLLVWL